MNVLLLVIGAILCSAIAGLTLFRKKGAALAPALIGFFSIAGIACCAVFFSSVASPIVKSLGSWSLPFAHLIVGIDPLSAWFFLPLFLLTACASFFGIQYVSNVSGDNRTHWFYFGLLTAGMAGVLVARNAILFLMAWEVMSLSSFMLILYNQADRTVVRAAWIYFVATHIGTAFILLAFLTLFLHTGSFDFALWAGNSMPVKSAAIVFLLALIGFGAKAGIIPFHVWLPVAHPAAPSHVSAIMSGIMIKMGIYGILRMLTFLHPWQEWWGIAFVAIGAVSGIMGVLFALGQHEIKRLLAFHSVENIGIIALGLGLGVVGVTANKPLLAVFGFAGALLHVINHALFKGLLFLGAGAVIRETKTGEIDLLGGQIKKMPFVAISFLIGATAICGLPFFNGFISELLIYRGSLHALMSRETVGVPVIALCLAVSLALIGGLASACFTKAFGAVFQGEARTVLPAPAAKTGWLMKCGMGTLALSCLAIGLGSRALCDPLLASVASLTGVIGPIERDAMASLLTKITLFMLAGVMVIVPCAWIYLRIVKKRSSAGTVTWDCGYARPQPTMQYTASSFASPVIEYFKNAVLEKKTAVVTTDLFPIKKWTFHSVVHDWFMDGLYSPFFGMIDRTLSRFRWLQSGKTGHYILFVALAVVILVLWKFYL